MMTTMMTSNNNSNNNNAASQESSTNSSTRIQLFFADLEDLSKRLVLMPRIEDEGVGAVIASYQSNNNNNNSKPPEASPSKKEQQASAQPEDCLATVSSESTECRDEKEETPTTTAATASTDNLVGCILVGTSQNEDLTDAEFSDILSAIREQQEGPLVLHLEKPADPTSVEGALRLEKSASSSSSSNSDCNHSKVHNDSDDDEDDVSTVSGSDNSETAFSKQPPQPQEDKDDNAVPETITSPSPATPAATNTNTAPNANSLLSGRLANWGSRMRVGAHFAAQAASTAAFQAANAAAEARRTQLQSPAGANTSNSNAKDKESPVGLHVQTSLGAFLPLQQKQQYGSSKSPRGNSELNITTSSVLYVRKTAVEPCPPRGGFSFQWYKGVPSLEEDAPLDEWTLLPEADTAAFQPSTTEVGYRLLCVVTIPGLTMDDDSDSGSDDSDDDDNNNDNANRTIRCMTPYVVAADMSLFNGARQALVRGAHFGQLQGHGKAQGRTFRLQVEMGSWKKRVASAVKLDQVVDGTAEPLHDEAFHHVTAASHGAKGLKLKLRPEQVSDASMVSALLSNEEEGESYGNALELMAPNRFARESLLLAIGIANFKGKPADLESTTILYHINEEEDVMDDSSNSSSGKASLSSKNTNLSGSVTPVKDQQQQPSGPQVVDKLALSPAKSDSQKDNDDENSVFSQSSAGDLSTLASSSVAPASVHSMTAKQEPAGSNERQLELEKEVTFLRAKLAKKDKVVSELQRQVTRSDAAVHQANQQASEYQQQVRDVQAELQSCQNVYRAAQQAVEDQSASLKQLKSEHSVQVIKLKEQVESQANTIAELEKTVKSHQNEKAVLSAAVEARENKLTKMGELEESYMALSSKVSEQDQWRKELQETTERYNELKTDFQKVSQLEKECRNELETAEQTIQSLNEELQSHKDTAASCKKELQAVQSKNQKLKSERNSYKQKADSLSKEISRICKNGRTLGDVERMIANEGTLKEEVELLRKQKRKALEECHSYRKSYEQNRAAQQIIAASPGKSKANQQNDPTAIMERNVELERLVTELTEYVNAKEMQLETLMQVNTALQEEIHGLAKANMSTNEV